MYIKSWKQKIKVKLFLTESNSLIRFPIFKIKFSNCPFYFQTLRHEIQTPPKLTVGHLQSANFIIK